MTSAETEMQALETVPYKGKDRKIQEITLFSDEEIVYTRGLSRMTKTSRYILVYGMLMVTDRRVIFSPAGRTRKLPYATVWERDLTDIRNVYHERKKLSKSDFVTGLGLDLPFKLARRFVKTLCIELVDESKHYFTIESNFNRNLDHLRTGKVDAVANEIRMAIIQARGGAVRTASETTSSDQPPRRGAEQVTPALSGAVDVDRAVDAYRHGLVTAQAVVSPTLPTDLDPSTQRAWLKGYDDGMTVIESISSLPYDLTDRKRLSAFVEGLNAVINGLSWDDCPYNSGDPDRLSAWYDGYHTLAEVTVTGYPLPFSSSKPEGSSKLHSRGHFYSGAIAARNGLPEEANPWNDSGLIGFKTWHDAWLAGYKAEVERQIVPSPRKFTEYIQESVETGTA